MDNNSPYYRSDDDDYYNPYYSPTPSSQTYSYEQTPEHVVPLGSRVWELLDRVTGSHFAFIFTIVVILFVQFKRPLLRWYRNFIFRFRYMTLGEWLADLWWTALDYIRAVWHMALEIGRNSLQLLVPVNSETPAHPRRRRIQLRRRSGNRNAAMPDLEEDEQTNGPPAGVVGVEESRGSNEQRPRLQWNQTELEPAFLRDSDYPAGWMVYHPVLGVVSKVAADKYDSQQQERRKPDDERGEKPSPVVYAASKRQNGKRENGAGSYFTHTDAVSQNGTSPIPSPRQSPQKSEVKVLRSIAASG